MCPKLRPSAPRVKRTPTPMPKTSGRTPSPSRAPTPAAVPVCRDAFVSQRRSVALEWSHYPKGATQPFVGWCASVTTDPDIGLIVRLRRHYTSSKQTSAEVEFRLLPEEFPGLLHMLNEAARRLGAPRQADLWQEYQQSTSEATR